MRQAAIGIRARRSVDVTSLVLGLCLQVSAAQDQEVQTPLFRTGIHTVEVIAVVRDRQGNPVRGLTREDFAVEENGVAQDITIFSPVDLPQSGPTAKQTTGARTPWPDVVSNVFRTGRSYVLVLDAQHVDPLRSGRVRLLAKKFIDEYLYEGDMAAVLTLGTGIRSQGFTTDKPRLTAAVESFVGGKTGSATLNKFTLGRDPVAVKAFDARVLFESVRRICDSLGAVTGTRRAVVLFSEGVEIDMTDLVGPNPTMGGAELIRSSLPSTYAAELLAGQKAMLDAAERSNVALYTVDPRGSTIGEDTLMQVGGLSPGAVPPTLDILREVQRSQGSLRLFADQTGGLALVNSNDFDRGFKQLVEANSAYYVLGYTPAPRGTGFRKIHVRVGQSGAVVTARSGYFADAPVAASMMSMPQAKIELAGASPRMQELLANPLQRAGLDLHATAANLAARGRDHVVAIVAELAGAALSFANEGGTLSSDIEVGVIAVDRDGKVRWSHASAGTLRLPEAERPRVGMGLRLILEAPLPPGEYQVRLALIERTRGLAGSVVLDVDVRRASNPGTVTGLLFLQEGDDVPTSGNAAVLKSLLPSTPPTTRRRFSTSQRFSVFAALSPSSTVARPIEVTLVVIRDDGSEALRLPAAPAVARQVGKASALGALMTVPIDALAPGSYRLYVAVHDGRRTVASAPIAFSLEPMSGNGVMSGRRPR